MAHGKRAATVENKRRDYWTNRPGNRGGGIRCSYTKKKTHRIERRNAKRDVVRASKEVEQ